MIWFTQPELVVSIKSHNGNDDVIASQQIPNSLGCTVVPSKSATLNAIKYFYNDK
jgi:hypothetical protein